MFTRSTRFNARTALLLALLVGAGTLISLAAFAVAPPSTGGEQYEGTWEPTYTNDCPQGFTCVKWEYSLGEGEPCCIENSMVGTAVYSYCSSSLRHPH